MGRGIALTDRAARRIQKILSSNRKAQGLRLKVVGGGRSGLKYELDLDMEQSGDLVFEKAEARVLVDPRSFLYLSRAELDYEEGLIVSGFVIKNPHSTQVCPCDAFPVYSEAPFVPNIW